MWTDYGGTRQTLTEIAAGVTFAKPRPVSVGLKVGDVPTRFELVAAGSADGGLMLPAGALSYLRLVQGQGAYSGLTDPDPGKTVPTIELRIYPRGWNESPPGATGTQPYCTAESICYRLTDDRKYEIQITAEPAPYEDLRRILESVTVADLADRATWFDAAEAAG